MTNPYGPWATLIDAGRNPQLSTFWRQRLGMLVPASRTSPVLAWRHLLGLGTIAALMLALPTVRASRSMAEEKIAAQGDGQPRSAEQKSSANSPPKAQKQSQTGDKDAATKVGAGFYTSQAGVIPSGFIAVPAYIYYLSDEQTRKDLKMTGQQEAGLRRISRDYVKQRQELIRDAQVAMAKLPAREQPLAQRQLREKLVQLTRTVRKQIEGLLTRKQLPPLRADLLGWLLANNGLHVLDEEKRKQLLKAFRDEAASTTEIDEKLLAVITPQQWDQIEEIFSPSALGGNWDSGLDSATLFDRDPAAALNAKRLRKELDLLKQPGQELLASYERTFARSVASQAKMTDFRRRLAEAAEVVDVMQNVMQHARIWQNEPEAIRKKYGLQQHFLSALASFRATQTSTAAEALLDRIHATEEQKEEIRRLQAKRDGLALQSMRQAGEVVARFLTPEQQEKVLETLDQQAQ
jgi:hypothetical protein